MVGFAVLAWQPLPATVVRLFFSVPLRFTGWSPGPHFIVVKLAVALLLMAVLFRGRLTALARLRNLGWRRLAFACGAGAVVFYVAWTFYLGDTMPSTTVAYNWNVAWVALDGFEGLTALLTTFFLFRDSNYAALSAASFSTSLCIDALFNVITAGQGSALVTAVLEAGLVEGPFAVLSAVLAVKLISGGHTSE
ncbi:hypothetical protein KIH31_03340 [Paenarthrobacter sp. DKR-5]|uniref:hypothetical protein n=1 Tax=Paenarthrobacter sp. DKR-5 TaxID=2835535 RepID=UPI001BDDA841|nr:hypothetical protein [Paenarthrobacter sp. DKR-5]MBT1001627.1 hypothetical protein [Paenarthrobacter sp. DKR-5]